jgi:hypothetical protein
VREESRPICSNSASPGHATLGLEQVAEHLALQLNARTWSEARSSFWGCIYHATPHKLTEGSPWAATVLHPVNLELVDGLR